MKSPAPSETGIETVIDFAQARAKASRELRSLLAITRNGLTAGLSAAEIRDRETMKERNNIVRAIKRLADYTSALETQQFVDTVLQQMMAQRGGGRR